MIAVSTMRLTRRELAEYLSRKGYPIRPATLAKLAATTGGPPYSKFGKHVIYDAKEALEWAEGRRSPSVARFRDLEAA